MSEALRQSQTRKDSLTKGLSYCMDGATRDISTRGLDGDLSKATEQPHLSD